MTDYITIEVAMGSLNHIELPVRINPKEAHGAECRDSRLRRTSSDSGTGSADKEDEDISQNGEMSTLISANENQFSGDVKNMQNNSCSRRVPCNEIGHNKFPDNSSLSKIAVSSGGLQQLGKRIERQDGVDIPPSEDNKENLVQTQPAIPSCDSQNNEKNFLQTPPATSSCDSQNNEENFLQTPSVIPLWMQQNNGVNLFPTVPVISPNNAKTVTDDLLQTPLMNCSYRNNCSEKQFMNIGNRSEGTLESPTDEVNTYEVTSEKQRNDSSNHSDLMDNEIDKIQILHHRLQSRASPCELQKKLCEGSEISASGLSHDSIPRCLPAPTASAKMSHRNPESMSFLVSPMDLVPQHLVDNLSRELNRERCRVKMLQTDNNRLNMIVTELERRCQTVTTKYFEDISRFKEAMQLQRQNVVLLKNNADVWQRKFHGKDTELSTTQRLLNDSRVRCQQLEEQIKILKAKFIKEERTNKTLNESLEKILETERTRFDRDESRWKEKIEDLKKANKWLREKLTEHGEYSMPLTPEQGRDLRVSMRSHTDTESGGQQSNETQLKGVSHENTVCQAQMTLPTQKPKKLIDYKSQETHHASLELEYVKAATQETDPQNVEKCSHCYIKASEFNSWKEFMDHKRRCEQ